MSTILDVPHFEQSGEGYCLPACARMVLAYLGMERTEAEIAQLLGTQRFGTPNFAIVKLAAWGVEVDFRVWELEELLSALAKGQPVILFVQTGFLDYWEEDFGHAIVVVGVTDKQQFWIHDPSQPKGARQASLNGLLAAWCEFGYKGAALRVMPQKPSWLRRALGWFRQKEST